MLGGPRWLALEVKYLDRAVAFYEAFLDLEPRERTESEARLPVGETDLVLRRPSGVPRGGLHVHYALTTPSSEYDAWFDRLSSDFDLTQHRFGDARSLYFDDLAGNCVEIGERDEAGRGLTGLFEVVLEVTDIDRAVAFYEALGCSVVDRGNDRERVRLQADGFDLELWEPHLGLADARGGVHVDLGLAAEDPDAAAEAVADRACAVDRLAEGVRVTDPDGHVLTFS